MKGEKEMYGDNYATPKWLMDMFKDYFDPCPLNESPLVDGLKREEGKNEIKGFK